MSRSLTVKPSVGGTTNRGRGNTRGRGRGTQPFSPAQSQQARRGRGIKMDHNQYSPQNNLDGDAESSENMPRDNTQEDRMQRRDAYTVIAPNEKKRQQISNQARQGEAAYQKHKEAKKVGYVSCGGTVGGTSASESPSRAAAGRLQNQPFKSPFEKSRHYKEKAKREEDAQLNVKKQEQRRKSEQNTMRDSARQRGHDRDRRSQNEAFLARIEQDTRQKQQQKLLQSSAASYQPRGETSRDVPESYRTTSQYDGTAGAGGYSHQYSATLDNQNSTPLDHRDAAPLDELAARFPTYDRDYLHGLLLQMHGDIDAVCGILSD